MTNDDAEALQRIKDGAGKDLQGVDEKPDLQTQVEEKTVELDKARAEVFGLRQDIEERKKYAERIFFLICCWVSALLVLLFLEGFGGWPWLRFLLPQPVILAAIGSTTINVLGLFYIVAHYLFPDRTHRSKHADPKKD